MGMKDRWPITEQELIVMSKGYIIGGYFESEKHAQAVVHERCLETHDKDISMTGGGDCKKCAGKGYYMRYLKESEQFQDQHGTRFAEWKLCPGCNGTAFHVSLKDAGFWF